MLRQVLDQRLAKLGPAAGDRQRQVQRDRLARLGLGSQAIAPVDRAKVQRESGTAARHAVIVAGAERLTHLPVKSGLGPFA